MSDASDYEMAVAATMTPTDEFLPDEPSLEVIRTGWQKKVEWMREAGVTQASWEPNGDLTSATLGPKPTQPEESPETQPLTKEAQALRLQAEQARIATGATSRFVPVTNLERLANDRSGDLP